MQTRLCGRAGFALQRRLGSAWCSSLRVNLLNLSKVGAMWLGALRVSERSSLGFHPFLEAAYEAHSVAV